MVAKQDRRRANRRTGRIARFRTITELQLLNACGLHGLANRDRVLHVLYW